MIPTDLDIAHLCLSSETDHSGFDFFDDGAEMGVCFGIKNYDNRQVVVFRGSITAEDWWRDGQALMTDVSGIGRVHSGFFKGMMETSCRINSLLTDQNPIIGGHSLGAARASIYGAIFRTQSLLVTLGSPRVGDAEFVSQFRGKEVRAYKNGHDPITDVPVPLAPEFDFTHIREFIRVDAVIDHSLGPIFDYHHCANYIEGMKRAGIS